MRYNTEELKLIFFDVGFGDCMLAECGKQTLLIDGGSWYAGSLQKYIRDNHISKINYIICTHAHDDHVDGLAEILEEIEFDEVFCNIENMPSQLGFCRLKHIVERAGKKINVPSLGERFYLGEAEVKFLSPDKDHHYDNGNDCSLIVMIAHKDKHVLMTGDAGSTAIQNLLESGFCVKADILKIPHHGLDMISEGFVTAVSPQYAIIQYADSGKQKINPELMDMLSDKGIKVFRTDVSGDIICSLSDNIIEIRNIDLECAVRRKKLLLLGANAENLQIIETAREMGVTTIVTDNVIGAAAKKNADKYYDIDGKDILQLKEMAERERVDGILLGAADPLVSSYYEICRLMNLPCYLQKENIEFFTNKIFFKAICQENGLSVVKDYYTGSGLYRPDKHDFPVVVKPAVGRGGKGVFLCKNEEEFNLNFYKAQSYSDNSEVIVEEFMDGSEVTAYYMFYNGVVKFIALSDRLITKGEGEISPVTYGSIYPSVYTEAFLNQCHKEFCQIFNRLNIRNGIFEVQIFVKKGVFYPYDPACVLGGELSSKIFPQVLGSHTIESLICYSLTGNMMMHEYKSKDSKIDDEKCAASIWFLLKPGTIGKVRGIDVISKKPYILGSVWRLSEGDTVTEEMYGTEKSVLGRVWICADTKSELTNIISQIRSQVMVWDIHNNMILEYRQTK